MRPRRAAAGTDLIGLSFMHIECQNVPIAHFAVVIRYWESAKLLHMVSFISWWSRLFVTNDKVRALTTDKAEPATVTFISYRWFH